jgi:glycosyltransferase involved in cell wall biosynthesis
MPTVLFDATRLFVRGSRFSPTGIDRVVLAYARWLLARPDVDLAPVVTAGGRLWRAPRALLAGIVEGAEAFSVASRVNDDASPAWPALTATLEQPPGGAPPLRSGPIAGQVPLRALWHAGAFARGLWRLRPARPAPGAIYLNVSHTGLGDPGALASVARGGAKPVLMLHDLIPITHPEYCAPSARARHERRMQGVLAHAALVVTNSKSTAADLADYAAGRGMACPGAVVAPLGVESDFLSPPAPLAPARRYFVCVGTLEARKNLAFLLALWRRLAEQLGDEAPRLVLVGRRGWENESVLDHLQRSDAAARLVCEVSDLTDRELAQLIGGAAALLAPSLAEGYDLPVAEALALGAPVIASDIAVHRELAAGALLIDPLDGPGWLAAIQAPPAPRPAPRRGPSWEDHFTLVGERILALGAIVRGAGQ